MFRLIRCPISVCVTATILAACAQSSTFPPTTVTSQQAAPLRSNSIRATATSYSVLFRFPDSGQDGASPQAGLVSLGGVFYGTTYRGGNSSCYDELGCGTVFELTSAGKQKVLYRFQGGTGDGENPIAGLVEVGGSLYGATQVGGEYGDGTIFKISTSGSEKVIYNFQGGSDGANPLATLIAVGDILYGTTYNGGGGSQCGGSVGCGTIFQVSTSGTEKLLHSFQGGTDGGHPWGSLLYLKPTFYGTTSADGAGSSGTVFKMSSAGKEKVIYAFKGSPDGASPQAGLIALNGTLYGTTFYGGTGTGCGTVTCGTIFKASVAGKESVIYDFGGTTDGSNPWAPLTTIKSKLYGAASAGGKNNVGNIFELSSTSSTWRERVLHTFKGGKDGANPIAALLPVSGALYGTTFGGGGASGGAGTVFTLSP
jgi:uncharacterized repeat protein (TIGR03803 family)